MIKDIIIEDSGISSARSKGSIDFAYSYAKQAHKGQLRKYTGEDYITHPLAVAKLVASVTDCCFTIEAALLHDVLEDCPVSTKDLEEAGFFCIVRRYVLELTQFSSPEDGGRKFRKALDRRYLARASQQAKTIKLADLIHNSESILEYGGPFAGVYMKEMKDLLYVLSEGNLTLYSRAMDIVSKWEQRL